MNLIQDKPPTGKFVALFNDGSGCELFMIKDNQLYDGEMYPHDMDTLDDYLFWLPVDDSYKFWEEK